MTSVLLPQFLLVLEKQGIICPVFDYASITEIVPLKASKIIFLALSGLKLI